MNGFQYFQPVHIRHTYVHIHQIESMLGKERQSFLSAAGCCNFEPGALQNARYRPEQIWFIINDQNMGRLDHASASLQTGSQTVNFAPPVETFSTRMRPRCCSTISCVMVSPRPVP